MKDPTIPPVVKLKGASLASVMGATLATKRSSAERLAPGVDPNKLVVVPYANPFRTYPLANDYEKFKKLVEEKNVDCYIVNTGDFMGKKVKPADTLGILESRKKILWVSSKLSLRNVLISISGVRSPISRSWTGKALCRI